uniref:hypothetical protein n=1 Tax=uncultured Bifidobacterium sp. TaxID=165187 RepID=UPI0026036A63
LPWAITARPLILPTVKPPVITPMAIAAEALATITIATVPLVAATGTAIAIPRPTTVVIMAMMPVSAIPVGMEITTWTITILPTAVAVITPVEMAILVGIPAEAAVTILTIMPVSTMVTLEPVVPAPAEGPLTIPILGTTLFATLAVMAVEVAGTVTSGAVSARVRPALVETRRAAAARPEAAWARTAPTPSAIAPGMIVFFCHQCP